MQKEQLTALFPRASKEFIRINAGLFASQPEQDVRSAVVGEASGEAESNARTRVSIVMYRVRALDKDNAYGACKPLLDCLRICHLIPDDSERHIALKVSQVKAAHRCDQKTEVNIMYG